MFVRIFGMGAYLGAFNPRSFHNFVFRSVAQSVDVLVGMSVVGAIDDEIDFIVLILHFPFGTARQRS
jgi:hypothetical protein